MWKKRKTGGNIGKSRLIIATPESIESKDEGGRESLVLITPEPRPERYREVERYFLEKPYTSVLILEDVDNNEYLYHVEEPELNDEEEFFLKEIEEKLKNALLFTEIRSKDKEEILKDKIKEVVARHHIKIGQDSIDKIIYYIIRDFVYFGKIDVLMSDPNIEDISCTGCDITVFVFHKKYGSLRTNVRFNEREIDSFVVRIAQKGDKHISLSNPMVDTALQDGSRAQLTLGRGVTTKGSTFTIRKFHETVITPVDLIRWGTFSPENMAYLWLAVDNRKSILFVGGTASGKTTSLNAVSLFIPPNAKIVTIEDTRELRLPHDNWIPGVTKEIFMGGKVGRIEMYDLLKAALRQRPEYILVGEVRGNEAQVLFQAMSTGHTSFSTFHADSVDSTIHRLEYPPLSVPRSMIQALEIISIQAQVITSDGKKKRRTFEITEILEIDPTTRNIKTRKLFEWDPASDSFKNLDIFASKILNDIARFKGWSRSDLIEDFDVRVELLEILASKEITSDEFISIVRSFQANPEKVRRLYGI